jgi:hypothetical protein
MDSAFFWFLEAQRNLQLANFYFSLYIGAANALSGANDTINSLSTANSQLTAQRDALQVQFDDVSTQLANAQSEFDVVNAELTTAIGQISGLEADLLTEQQAHLQTQVEAQVAAQDAQSEILALSEDLTATAEERDQALADFNVLQDDFNLSQDNLAIQTIKAIEAVPRAFGDILSTMFGADRADELINTPVVDLVDNFRFTLPEFPTSATVRGKATLELGASGSLPQLEPADPFKPLPSVKREPLGPEKKVFEHKPIEFPKVGAPENFPIGESKNFPVSKGGLLRNVDEEEKTGLLQRFRNN